MRDNELVRVEEIVRVDELLVDVTDDALTDDALTDDAVAEALGAEAAAAAASLFCLIGKTMEAMMAAAVVGSWR